MIDEKKHLDKPEKGRLRAEEALQVSQTRYRRLFETAQDGILVLDADTGKITDVNPFLIDMLGYSHEELLGKELCDIGLFKDIVASKAAFLDLKTRGYVRYEDLPFETKDGRSIEVEFVSNVYLVNHNKIIQCNIREITQRRQAESVSQEARRFAESLIDTVREPFVVLGKDLKVLSANRSFYSTFKVTHGETVGNLIYDIGNRQWDIPSLRKLLEDILPKNTQFSNCEVSHKFQTIGQKIMLLNARQIYQKVIGTPMILLAIEDITERRQMEIELEAAAERYRRLFETTPDGLLLLDKKTGRIINVNPAIVKLLGFSSEEFEGKELKDIGLMKDIEDFQKILDILNEVGLVHYDLVTAETREGKSIDTEIYLIDRAKVIQCNIRDITVRRQAEKASQEARRYAENIINTVREPFVVLDKDLKVFSANHSFYSTFKVTASETVGNLIYDIGNRQWDIPSLRKLLEDILPKNTQFTNFEVSHNFQTIGQKIMLLNARQIYQEVIGTPMVLLAIEDITEKRRMEDELSKYREHLEQLVEERTTELKMTNEQLQLDITERKKAEVKAKRCAVEFKRAYEEMKQLNRDLSTLYTIDFAAAQSLDMEIMLNKVLETVLKALEIEAGSIYLREPNGDMTLYVYHGFSGEFVDNMQHIKSGEGVFDAVYAEKKPVVLDALYPANRFASFIIQEEFHTLVIVPLISGSELIGILCMASRKAHAFPLGETELLSAIGQQMGTTMRNAWLYERVQRELNERKRAEKALRESEEKYRGLMNNARDAIILMDMQGNLLEINRKTEALLGHMNEEVFNEHFSQFIPKKELKRTIAAFEDLIQNGSGVLGDVNLLKKDGTTVPVDMTGTIIQYAGKKVAQAIFRDITERKKAEFMQRKLSSAVEHTADIVIVVKKDGIIEYVNPAFEKITGYTIEEAVGKTPRILKSGKQDKKFYEHLWRTILSGEVFYGVLINKKNNGELYYAEKTITPIKDEHGTITHFVSTDKDITERKKAEEVHLENLRLEAADKAKSEFLANMSHELRTPLNASIGFSQLLEQGMGGKLSEKQKHYVDNILASNQFLLTLINDILDLSKIEAGKIELVPEKMSIPLTIKETLSLIKEKAMKHNVLLKTEFDPELEFIEADKQRFKQVLFNLLSNAVKFSKEEGGAVAITAKKEGDMATVSVSDTGIGIKEEIINKLFQKFEQLDSSICKKYGGTGLGLAITKQLVELHGGEIRAESKYGEGSTFTFMLPLKDKK